MAANAAQQAEKIVDQMNSGKFSTAAKTATIAMKRFPKDPRFANLAGMALAQSGREREAAVQFAKALKLAPGHNDVLQNLIKALIGAGELDKAQTQISAQLAKSPHPEAYLMLQALLELRQENLPSAVDTATRVLEADPNSVDALKLRANALRDMHLNDDAIKNFKRAVAMVPHDISLRVAMASPLDRELRVAEALECLQQAVGLDPANTGARFRYAQQLANANDINAARNQFQEILRLSPTHSGALEGLAGIGGEQEDASLIAQVNDGIATTARKDPSLPALHFAAARIEERLGHQDRALDHYTKANAAQSRLTPYDPAFAEMEFDRIFASAQDFPSISPDDVKPRPIFVVGQPRSGTTLTEMILSSNPSVLACGEIEATSLLMLPHIKNGSPFDPKRFADDFRKRLPLATQGFDAFVDKMPHNYLFLPHLAAALPDARLVHIERDPRDVAWSMWRANMTTSRQIFSFDMKAMAHSANLYRRYMAAWKERLGHRILTLNYEDIVNDMENQSRTLAAFCGIEWTEGMLSPETNKASARTASLHQVRQKVHSKSIGGWRQHSALLQTFNDLLDKDLWSDLDS